MSFKISAMFVVASLSFFVGAGPSAAFQKIQLEETLASESPELLAHDAAREGDPARGALLFYQPEMNCAKCHEPAGADGTRLGPDLSEKREVLATHLVQSILEPDKVIHEGFETVVVQTDDGDTFNGILQGDPATGLIQLARIEDTDTPLTFATDDVEWKKSALSTMPKGLANQLSNRGEFLDLISYLDSIAKEGAVRAAQLRPAHTLFPPPPLPEYESHIDHRGMISGFNNPAFDRGRKIFSLHCASCHGAIGDDGNVVEEGSMPTSLRFVDGKFKNGSDPHTMYRTLTRGYGMMNAQQWMVPQQKYDVIYFIREHYLRKHNSEQLFEITDEYLASLPEGDTSGPPPASSDPWVQMDYGPSFMLTMEIPSGSGLCGTDSNEEQAGNEEKTGNIAQKGIAIRLDEGPGGIGQGNFRMLYEHDTMRVAGAWSGPFIDYNGVNFNGRHNIHPTADGHVYFANPTGPGWGRPADGSFNDERVEGRDGRRYGPLARDWVHFRGMYRYGNRSILDYTVGSAQILESPALMYVEEHPVFVRQLNMGPRDHDLIMQVARVGKLNGRAGEAVFENGDQSVTGQQIVQFTRPPSEPQPGESTEPDEDDQSILQFDGTSYAQFDDGSRFDMTSTDYTVMARIKTTADGTIFCKTVDAADWEPDGKSFLIRDGRLVFDIGWVGAAHSDGKVDDGNWHDVAMTWSAADGHVKFFIDGVPSGEGNLSPEEPPVDNAVIRIGYTNESFPESSYFNGDMQSVGFFARALSEDELVGQISVLDNANDETGVDEKTGDAKSYLDAVATWTATAEIDGELNLIDTIGESSAQIRKQNSRPEFEQHGIAIGVSRSAGTVRWKIENGNLRLIIPAGDEPLRFSVMYGPVSSDHELDALTSALPADAPTDDLTLLTHGGAPNWPQILETEAIIDETDGPFAVDVFTRPTDNPWNCRMRMTGVDFEPNGDAAIVCAWDGSVWRVSGIAAAQTAGAKIQWQRIAAGLFQPLGVKIRDGEIFVSCRDQLVRLHDLNGDGEMDWYENFNSDHQVTEHFHEFAMGLQADDEGNFYYAKSARHALPALVPHHGTLLKIAADGSSTGIVAAGFRAANGVCINPDGSFYVTDQEGHWNPKNRINRVVPGGFYGNMFGYHDVTDESDSAMDPPLCWITNSFDRSPGELLRVDSPAWGSLNGSILNLSYGYGQIYIVTEEVVNGQYQGGMCALPIPRFPTGVMRGRFHSDDGQLYCCGMFAWSGTQQEPGGFYRLRRTAAEADLPVGLNAIESGLRIRFSDPIDAESASDPDNYRIKSWTIHRTANYGSEHFDEKLLKVVSAELEADGQTVRLEIPDIQPTRCMEIVYSIKSAGGKEFSGRIHNTIHELGAEAEDARR